LFTVLFRRNKPVGPIADALVEAVTRAANDGVESGVLVCFEPRSVPKAQLLSKSDDFLEYMWLELIKRMMAWTRIRSDAAIKIKKCRYNTMISKADYGIVHHRVHSSILFILSHLAWLDYH